MGVTVSISNQKGGSGKTSLTYNVGCVFAKEMKKKVLFVDADGQANLTTAFGVNPDGVEKDISELLKTPKPKTKDFIIETPIKNASLIPSNQHTFTAEKQLYDRTGREFVLPDLIDQVKAEWDYIFIDTPPNLGIITLNALIASNAIVLVYTASEFSLDGISQILNTIDEIQASNRLNINKVKIVGAIQNRYKPITKIVNQKLMKALEGVTELPRYFQYISDTTEIEKSQFEHQPVITYNGSHKVSQEFRKCAKELKKCLG